MISPIEVKILEGISPPEDYELECLVATTYSLNLSVYLSIISSASFSLNEKNTDLNLDGKSKEEWRRILLENAPKCIMFCDHHGSFEKNSAQFSEFERLVCDYLIKRSGRDTHHAGSLHSKFILAIYKNSKELLLARLFVGSKNFTLSTNGEFGAVYELREDKHHSANTKLNKSLLNFLLYLQNVEGIGSIERKLKPLHHAIQLLKKHTLLSADADFDFFWQGRFLLPPVKQQWKSLFESLRPYIQKGWKEAFIHSPWTRKNAVDNVHKELGIENKIHILCLKEPRLTVYENKNVKYQFNYSYTGNLESYQSHSKIYLFTKKKHALLIYGSANFTPDGWGIIESKGCNPNAEILVATHVNTTDFKYLKNIYGKSQNYIKPTFKETKADKIQKFINSIQIDVDYDPKHNKLQYDLVFGEINLKKFNSKIKITHELIESPESKIAQDLIIYNGWPVRNHIEHLINKETARCISSLIRIECPAMKVSTHLIVDLDTYFYNSRNELRMLQFKSHEVLLSLATLMNIAVPKEIIDGPDGGDDDDDNDKNERLIRAFVDGLRIERYAYNMSRLKFKDPTTFKNTINRIESLLAEIKKNKFLKYNKNLKEVQNILEYVHDICA